MEALWMKHLGALRPADEAAERTLRKLADGELITCDVKRPRNLRFFRKYWVLCGVVADQRGLTKENVDVLLRLRTGHVELFEVNGNTYTYPASLSFARMDEPAFESFWEQVVRVCCEEIIPGLQSEMLQREVMDLLS